LIPTYKPTPIRRKLKKDMRCPKKKIKPVPALRTIGHIISQKIVENPAIIETYRRGVISIERLEMMKSSDRPLILYT
jgi:hypothetical protein